MDGIIYQATNTVTGKSYIGQTIAKLTKRKRAHHNDVNNGSTTYFHSALRKHSFENFEWSILEEGKTLDELNLLEPEYIEKLGTLAPNGYNLTTGGKNCKASEIAKAKISSSLMGNKRHLGHKHTRAAKAKMGAVHIGNQNWLGKKHTDSTKTKISVALLGRRLTEEHKKKISLTQIGKKSFYSKLTEKQVLQIYDELAKGVKQNILAKKYEVNKTTIYDIDRGRTWKYLLKEN